MLWKQVHRRVSVEYIHAFGENTTFPDDSLDLYTIQLVNHELPDSATIALVAEAFCVLRPGGVFAMFDIDPRSDVNRILHPVIATLMKSTEPRTDQYYFLDIENVLSAAGFVRVVFAAQLHDTVVTLASSRKRVCNSHSETMLLILSYSWISSSQRHWRPVGLVSVTRYWCDHNLRGRKSDIRASTETTLAGLS